MRKTCLVVLLMGVEVCGCLRAEPVQSNELTIPNFDPDSPACVIKFEGASPESLRLNFSCLPKSAPTGFENPAPEVKVQSIRAKNAKGHMSLIDAVQSPLADRTRELNFCLYGKQNNFCGNAKVDGTSTIKAWIQRIELQDGGSQ
ncbi:hypothetical protein [Duganella sp. BJB1802]|uniref:hypothetical protein n=1 Tax=Duganella sp. BJB1802 TaxID=2744575 RepID=UPI001C3C7E05|nr:hypothetical protein [Duganella sp. BJB1802]